MHWIDITIIVVLAITSIIGLSKGLFESVLSLFGTGLSLFAAVWASKPVTAFVNGFFDLTAWISNMLVDQGVAVGGSVTIPGGFSFPLDKAAEFLTTVGMVVVLFVLIKLVIFILSRLFDSITSSSSALSGLNRLLGLVFGFAKGAVAVGMALALSVLVGKVVFTAEIKAQIDGTNEITRIVYGYVEDWTNEQFEAQLRAILGDPETDEETPGGDEEGETPGDDETPGEGETPGGDEAPGDDEVPGDE